MSDDRRTMRTAPGLAGEATTRVQLRLERTRRSWGPKLAALLVGDGRGGETIDVGTPEEIVVVILARPRAADEKHALRRLRATDFLFGPVPAWALNCARFVTRGDLGDWYVGWLATRYRAEN
jgi:hypothetical protein